MSPAIHSLGSARAAGREVFTLQLGDLKDFPSRLGLPCARFVLLIAADFSTTGADRYAIAERILDAGCVYFCAWGPGCELMHDLADEAFVIRQAASSDGGAVMTTSHADESLAEAVEFALRSAEPDGAFSDACEAIVLVAVTPVASIAEFEAAARGVLAS